MSNRSDPVDADGQRSERIHEIVNDCLLRRSAGEVIRDESIIEAHADLMPELAERLRSLHLIQEAERQSLQPPAHGLRIGCPHCHNSLEIVEEASLSDVVCPSCGSHFNLVEEADRTFQASRLQQINHLQLLDKLGAGASGVADNESSETTQNSPGDPDESLVDASPASPDGESSDHSGRIGRYRIEKILGKGGFGLVYLAHDEQLDRPVAVKVPHTSLISRPEDAEAYRAEARTVANLDHPNIVPVHDVGSTQQCPCFVVSKYVEGNDLSKKLKQHRLTSTEAAELVATVAEALHYAHKQGLVHRDVKPSNILIGKDEKPYVVDFGLALREENIGKGPKYAGTPAYMSPEQARGEGHRVDGRSDIYSLGAVFYELLTGRRTFSTDTQSELLEQIASQEVKPPRQIDDTVPKELERICLKALSKRATERHTTALDMADELRSALAAAAVLPTRAIRRTGSPIPRNEARLPLAQEDYDRLARSVTVPRLLLHLIDRKQHEAQLRRAIEASRQRKPPCPVVSVVTGGELQCHDQFVERLKEVALPAILGMDRDVESVRAVYIDFPGHFEDSASFHQYLRSDLARRMRLHGEERSERIAHALRDRPTLVHAEMSTADWDRQGQQKADSFFRFWDQLQGVGGLPLIVCLRVKYYRGVGVLDRWRFSKRNRQMRKHFGGLDLSAYGRVSGVVLSELQSITRKEAEDWVQGEASEILDSRELLPRIRRLYQRVTGIPMETLTMELRNMIEGIASP